MGLKLTVLVSLSLGVIGSGAWPCAAAAAVDPMSKRIELLIRDLASDRYSRRQQAATELRHIGAPAVDQLLVAQYHSDPEISLTAKRLLGQLGLVFVRENDATVVKYALRNYQGLPSPARADRGSWLAELEDGRGIDAVCRIVRYEISELLAKQVALDLMESVDGTDSEQRERLSRSVRETLGDSQRRPAKWLRALDRSWKGPPNQAGMLGAWNQLIDEETELLEGAQSAPSIVARLTQQYAEQAWRAGSPDLVRKAVLQLVELRRDSSRQLLQLCRWLMDHDRGDLFEELIYEQFEELRQDNPVLCYCAAELQKQRGDNEQAESLANKAFEMTLAGARDPREVMILRFETAIHLEGRGLTDWAVREYQRIIETNIRHWQMSDIRRRSIRLLAELLHDRQRDKEAADILALLVKDFEELVFDEEEIEPDMRDILSRHYYFRSEQFRQEANREKQIEFLEKGIKVNPVDADVLIAMYRLPRADEEWKTMTRQYLRDAEGTFNDRIKVLEADGIVANRSEIATELNQVAWLIGNTEGPQKAAVQQSIRSLELRPRSAGSLDTLGRTYFAVGDLGNALKYQRRAVELEPHSQQIRRQLVEFELSASQGAQDTGGATNGVDDR